MIRLACCSNCGVVGQLGNPDKYSGKPMVKIEVHHTSYLPCRTVLLCKSCHGKAGNHQGRMARIFYSRKGLIEPSNGFQFGRIRPMTERERSIRKAMKASRFEKDFTLEELFDWCFESRPGVLKVL